MLLAIEQGNTNTLFAVHDGDRWIAQWRAATESTRPADEYAVWLSQLLGMAVADVRINIAEIRKPELDSQLVADSIAQQIEKRVMFRRAMKRAVMSTMRSGALGVKVRVSGRLNGSEIARTEWYREGRIPLHTFRADIDYGLSEARTTYGIIGVKVWIFKGEVFDKGELAQPAAAEGEAAAGGAAPAAPEAAAPAQA